MNLKETLKIIYYFYILKRGLDAMKYLQNLNFVCIGISRLTGLEPVPTGLGNLCKANRNKDYSSSTTFPTMCKCD